MRMNFFAAILSFIVASAGLVNIAYADNGERIDLQAENHRPGPGDFNPYDILTPELTCYCSEADDLSQVIYQEPANGWQSCSESFFKLCAEAGGLVYVGK